MSGGGDKRDAGSEPEEPDNRGRSSPDPAEGPDDTPPPTPDSPQG